MDNKQLRILAEAATDGPWVRFINEHGICDVLPAMRQETIAATVSQPDAAFIAAANPKAVIELLDKLGARQAKIDALMLEYCPDEMTQEQRAEWAANQVPEQS